MDGYRLMIVQLMVALMVEPMDALIMAAMSLKRLENSQNDLEVVASL